MKQNATRKLFQYWSSLRTGENLPPERNAFRPGLVSELMPYLFIVENSETAINGIVRLAGNGLFNVYNHELTGTNFFDLWSAADQLAMDEAFAELRTGADGVVITAALGEGEGGQILSEFLLLPLSHPEGPKIIGIQALADSEMASKLAKSWWRNETHPGVNVILSKTRARPPAFGIADVFAPKAELNIIEFARRGRVPADARRVGHLSVIEGGAN
jgi:hypothetical protein